MYTDGFEFGRSDEKWRHPKQKFKLVVQHSNYQKMPYKRQIVVRWVWSSTCFWFCEAKYVDGGGGRRDPEGSMEPFSHFFMVQHTCKRFCQLPVIFRHGVGEVAWKMNHECYRWRSESSHHSFVLLSTNVSLPKDTFLEIGCNLTKPIPKILLVNDTF